MLLFVLLGITGDLNVEMFQHHSNHTVACFFHFSHLIFVLVECIRACAGNVIIIFNSIAILLLGDECKKKKKQRLPSV